MSNTTVRVICPYRKKTKHKTMKDVENCMNIRVNIVNSNLIMDGYTGKRLSPIRL